MLAAEEAGSMLAEEEEAGSMRAVEAGSMRAAEAGPMREAEAGPMLAAEAMRVADVEAGAMLAAEAKSMPMAEAEMLAAEGLAKARAMLAAEVAAVDREDEEVLCERSCRFRNCVCCWEFVSLTHRVAPGIDYIRIPDANCGPAAWSLLVGVTDGASCLRVSRLRVARSGRILGRSDDALELFHNINLAKQKESCYEAGAAPLPPNGRSLCVLRNHFDEKPQALQLALHPQQAKDTPMELPLPDIEGTTRYCIPISAGDHVWALSATVQDEDIDSFSVVMRRLVYKPCGGWQWEQAGDPFTSPLIGHKFPRWGGMFLQGYAVLPDANRILVSFKQYGLFLTFATDTCCWNQVLTVSDTGDERQETMTQEGPYAANYIDETRSQDYLPIFGRGIYVKQHKAVYMLHYNSIYSYKITYQQDDDQGMAQQLKLDPPVVIDKVCPFIPKKGYGFLTCLGSDILCSVWISLARHTPCPCDHLHAIVTTFHLHDDTAQGSGGGIKVLQSTYRRVEMKPNPSADQRFCFLQEYEDQSSPVLQQHKEEQEDLTSCQHVGKLSCCRNTPTERSLVTTYTCSQCGGIAHAQHECCLQPVESFRIPPLGLSRRLPAGPASRQHQVCSSSPVVPVTIKKDLFIICKAGSRSAIYQTGLDDDVKSLKHIRDIDGPDYFNFFRSDSKIHAVPSRSAGMLEYSLNKEKLVIKRLVRRPTADPFVMVIRVGGETIAVTETLHVFHQTQLTCGSTTWLRYLPDVSDVVHRRVDISGYVAVNDDSFIVCDAFSCSCLLFDLGAKQWRVVMPWAVFKEDLPTTIPISGPLTGRCVFVDGFIYTCRDDGLAAYELLGEDHSVFLSKPIFLPFPRHLHCVGGDMCLDYAGKDVDSGANLFHVVQGENSRRGLQITTVKVKTKRRASNEMEPVGIDIMDSVSPPARSIHYTESVVPTCCFAF